MKGLKKKILKLSACILTALFGFSLFSAGTIYENRGYAEESSGETTEKYVFDECNETSPFAAIRMLGMRDRLGPNGLGILGDKWYAKGESSSIVNLDLGVSVNDWREATAMRIRFKSNGLKSAATDANDNNIAVGFGGVSTNGADVLRKRTKPYGKAKFTLPNGKTDSQLYYINNQIPYFVCGRWQNCYIELPLDDTTFEDVTPSNGEIFSAKPEENSQLDMSKIKYVFICFEPMNYAGICMDFGDVEIKIGGNWVTVFSAEAATEKTKSGTWKQTLSALAGNEYIADPFFTDEYGATTGAYRLSKIEKTPCVNHSDNNSDALCDLCLSPLPHPFYDLDEDGACDDCGSGICGGGVCKDENKDGACDVCGHTDYVEAVNPAPTPDPTPDPAPQPEKPENSEEKSGCGSGCNGKIRSGVFAVTAACALSVLSIFVRKQRKERKNEKK